MVTDPKAGRAVRQLTASEIHNIGPYYDRNAKSEEDDRIDFSSGDPEDLARVLNRDRAKPGLFMRGGKHSIGSLYTDTGMSYTMNADGSN